MRLETGVVKTGDTVDAVYDFDIEHVLRRQRFDARGSMS